MKVVIDISPLRSRHKTRGIGMYTRNLVEAIKSIDKRNQYILTTKLEQVDQVDLVHYPYFDLFFHTLPVIKKAKTVVTIHDLIPLIFPKYFKVGIRGRLNFYLQKLALRNVNAIITDSLNSKQDIQRLLKPEATKIHVIYLAALKEFSKQPQAKIKKITEKYKLPQDFALYVGDVNYNKNLTGLIEAFARVSQNFKNLHLVLVGKAFKDNALPQIQEIMQKISQYDLSYKVHLRSTIPLDPPDDLVAVYSAAKIYVQPSLYEGFGLPILEAFACSTPVVAGNTSSIPEIVDQAAILVDPTSVNSITSGIIKALKMDKYQREKLIKKGLEQAKKFSWEKTARKTIEVYKRLIKSD